MNSFILIEHLKDLLEGSKVKAAVFYSFNFEVEFFEHYLLPIFLPNAGFGTNKIQNNLLWRKYQSQLPPVTVFCDFHAKKDQAPTLEYEVKTVDIPRNEEGKKPCFHPKLTLVLTEDKKTKKEGLIVLGGSNNLTEAGWCSNREGVVSMNFEEQDGMPGPLREGLKAFLDTNWFETGPDARLDQLSEAEDSVLDFIKRCPGNGQDQYRLFSSTQGDLTTQFQDFVGSKEIEELEILSPYHSEGISLLANWQKDFSIQYLKLGIPFVGTDEVGMEEQLFTQMEKAGATWCRLKHEKEKQFRFNHSKVYRFRTGNAFYEIIGSTNFTQAGLRGTENGGNLEVTFGIKRSLSDWHTLLEPGSTDALSFRKADGEEEPRGDRVDVPEVAFTLDWNKEALEYKWDEKKAYSGQIEFVSRSIYIPQKSKSISLHRNPEILEQLAGNPIIPFRYKGHLFHFYPQQIGVAARPLPPELQLNDRQLLELWSLLGDSSDLETKADDLLEQFVERLTEEGDSVLKKVKVDQSDSTLNRMAAHLSGLLRLEEALGKKVKREEMDRQRERIAYYLTVENVDTLPGYLKLLESLHKEKAITTGFYYLLLSVIDERLYGGLIGKLTKKSGQKQLAEEKQKVVQKVRKKVRMQLKEKVDTDKIKWVEEMINA
jgi:HKD family nuclease